MAEERGVEQRVVLERLMADIQRRQDDPPTVDQCSECGDTGWRLVEGADRRVARRCPCSVPTIEARLEKMGVPPCNLPCTFDTLDLQGKDRSIQQAALAARGFVRGYPVDTAGCGLMLVGSYGTGKTHLATAMLRELVLERGVTGKYVDFRELFARLRRTYGEKATEEEDDVLGELYAADVLVLDDMGAARRTDWTFDICEGVIDAIYKRQGTTIITTNLPNLREGAGSVTTLGDRIGNRAWSRLQQKRRVLDMNGADYRILGGRG